MVSKRFFAAITVATGAIAFAHAVATWPALATLALFGGGAIVAFIAEAIVIKLGWLTHNIGPKVFDVPLYALFGWVGTTYVMFRIGLLVTDGWTAIIVAALLATTYDLLAEPQCVEDGYWTFSDDLPGPRYRGVPWWNSVGWFVVSCLTAALALPFL